MIRIGIVGCGRILAAHLRGYRLLREAGVDDFSITALCSLEATEARMYLRRGQQLPQRPAVSDLPGDPLAVGDEFLSDFQPGVEVEVHTDFRRMIAEAPIDAVNDFTTHALHHQVAAAAFARGKHLLSQKPIAVTVRAARRMCREAESRGLSFGVFENHRYKPATRHLRWLLDDGRFGHLQMMLFANVGTWWSPDRIVAETPWRHRRMEAGGIALDLGVHQFNVARHLGGEIKSVLGRAAVVEPVRFTRDAQGNVLDQIECDADDTFFATFDSHDRAVGNLTASWAGHGEPTVLGPGPVFYLSKARVTGDRVTLDDGSTVGLAAIYDEHCPAERKQRDFPLGLDEPFALLQHDWLEAIRRKRPPEIDGRESLRDLACAFAVLESDLAGRRVEVDEVANGELETYQQPINEHFGIV